MIHVYLKTSDEGFIGLFSRSLCKLLFGKNNSYCKVNPELAVVTSRSAVCVRALNLQRSLC